MKSLFLLVVLSACSTMSDSKYRKKYHIADYRSSEMTSKVHAMLTEKMTKCYNQSEYPLYEKTLSHFDEATFTGTISYKIDNQSKGPLTLVLVDVIKEGGGSLVKVYSKGDLFRPSGTFKHHIKKWLDGKKADCDAHGEI